MKRRTHRHRVSLLGVVLLCGLLLLCGCSSPDSSEPPSQGPTTAELVDQAIALLDGGKPEAALPLLEAAVSQEPEEPNAWCWLGSALYDLERYEKAVQAFDRALQLDPEWSDAWCSKGMALLALKRYEEADLSLYRALVRDPENGTAWFWRSRSFAEQDRLPESLVAVDKAVALEPDRAQYLTQQGAVLLRLERYDEALASLRDSLNLDGRQADAWCYKGLVQTVTGWHAGALESYSAALALDSRHPLAAMGKAMSLWNLERFEEAEGALVHALALNPSWDAGRQMRNQLTAYLDATPTPASPPTTVPPPAGHDGEYVCGTCGYRWPEDVEREVAGEAWYEYGHADFGDDYSDSKKGIDGATPEPPEWWFEDWKVYCPKCGSDNVEYR